MKRAINICHILFVILTLGMSCSEKAAKENRNSPPVPEQLKNVILSITCVAENSRTTFDYTYAENINDGRGITFGIIGFTSGTYDGTMLIRKIKQLDPSNILCRYLPAFEAIDENPHDEGMCDDITGLENFINDFSNHGNDPQVKRAQLELLETLYWLPAMSMFLETGSTLQITRGQFYDCCIQHGPKGLKRIIDETSDAVGGTPATGINEVRFLRKFLTLRYVSLNDPAASQIWRNSSDRVKMYERILNSGNISLQPPFEVYCYNRENKFVIDGSNP